MSTDNRHMEIIPAILPKRFSELEEKLALVRGAADTVQIDIADGRFVPNTTWPYTETQMRADTDTQMNTDTEGADKRGLNISENQRRYLRESASFVDFEFDLMVAKPAETIADFVKAGAARVFIHRESIAADALSALIDEWKHAVEIGIAIRPATPLSELETFLHEVNCIQCMGNDRIGFQGVSLDERVIPRIKELREKHPALAIAVDIGVNLTTAPRLVAAGATRLVAGSAIFGATDPRAAIAKFKSLV